MGARVVVGGGPHFVKKYTRYIVYINRSRCSVPLVCLNSDIGDVGLPTGSTGSTNERRYLMEEENVAQLRIHPCLVRYAMAMKQYPILGKTWGVFCLRWQRKKRVHLSSSSERGWMHNTKKLFVLGVIEPAHCFQRVL